MSETTQDKVAALPYWHGKVTLEPLSGGITNVNYKVNDDQGTFVVRLGSDIPEHLVLRSNELAAGRAAFEIGVSPEIVYSEPGILVARFIEGRVFEEEDVRQQTNLERIVPLIARFHREMPARFSGYSMMFWVFQVLRHYRGVLEAGQSPHQTVVKELMSIADHLEKTVGAVEIVYGHNDLLPANFIDDGERIWLIDFDYAGFNSPLFDLSNLASNNGLSPDMEQWMLSHYFQRDLSDAELKSYGAMKCASLLRETMWSMVSEIHSELDFDYGAYTTENLSRFEAAYSEFNEAIGK